LLDKYINIGNLKIAYTLSGNGPPIVLLHGWMCNRNFWKEQIQFLSKTYQVLAPDFRGHGDSDIPEGEYTIERLSDDLYKIIKRLTINKAVVVGHSMGGMVAQQFCVSHVEYVSGLILVSTIAADLEDRLISKRIEKDTPRLGFRNAFLRYFDGWFDIDTDPNIVRWVREQMLRTSESVGLNLTRSYRRFDLRTHISTLNIPTLVIGSASDASAVSDEAKTLTKLIPDAQLIMIEGCGHFPMLETPQKLNKTLKKFLSQNRLTVI